MTAVTTMETSGGLSIFTGPPGSGKTKAMIEWMRQAPEGVVRVYVHNSAQQAMQVWRQVSQEQAESPPHDPALYRLESWQFISLHELQGGYMPYPVQNRQVIPEFGLDDVFTILATFLHRNFHALSFDS